MYTFCEGNRDREVTGMLPLSTHLIKVVAVYRDGIEMERSTNFTHRGMYVASMKSEPFIMFCDLLQIAATLMISVLFQSLRDHQRLLFHGLLPVQAWICPIFVSL